MCLRSWMILFLSFVPSYWSYGKEVQNPIKSQPDALSSAVRGDLSEEEKRVRRIYDHLIIEDRMGAVREAREAFKKFPLSFKIHTALIDALSSVGEEVEAWELWQKSVCLFPEITTSRRILETIAWGVLGKGELSASTHIRINALLGACLTRDVKAIPLLLRALKSSSAPLRSIAVRLCVSYADLPLKEELERMLQEEKVWYVRQEVIRAVGQLHMTTLGDTLHELICQPQCLAEEKAQALMALVQMYSTLSTEQLKLFLSSNRSGLRELGCALMMHCNLKESARELLPLLRDTSPDVRLQALSALGFLRVSVIDGKPIRDQILALMEDSSPHVAITAAFVALLQQEAVGKAALEKWVLHEDAQLRRLASALLAGSGSYGIDVSCKLIHLTDDPYVQVNLALGLIGQRQDTQLAAQKIAHALQSSSSTLWMWDSASHPLARSLSPSRLLHIDPIPNYPSVVDQMTRLELLSILNRIDYPGAKEAVRSFLIDRKPHITAAAAMMLLQEGDEEDLSMISSLLDDPEPQVRMQAALLLAMLDKDPKVLRVLYAAYHEASREMKVHILEALAQIGSPESIPFLLEILKEPFQLLRVVAASALIQCLYH